MISLRFRVSANFKKDTLNENFDIIRLLRAYFSINSFIILSRCFAPWKSHYSSIYKIIIWTLSVCPTTLCLKNSFKVLFDDIIGYVYFINFRQKQSWTFKSENWKPRWMSKKNYWRRNAQNWKSWIRCSARGRKNLPCFSQSWFFFFVFIWNGAG